MPNGPEATLVSLAGRQLRTLLIVDIVESVRLIAAHETEVIGAWQQLLDKARQDWLPAQQGRLVKSLGDGLLAELPSPRAALLVVRRLHAALPEVNATLPADAQLALRAALHEAQVVVHELDVFGDGVNLCARLCALAPPGGIVASAAACDGLTDGVDAQFHDLGLCYLKHWPEPVRAYQLDGAKTAAPMAEADWRPVLAVCPEGAGDELAVLADDLADLLCQERELRVVSPWAVRALKGAAQGPAAVGRALHAAWLVAVGLRRVSAGWRLRVSLIEAASEQQLWSGQVHESDAALQTGQYAELPLLATTLVQAMRDIHVEAVVRRPLPTLESCALLQGAVARLYRSAPSDVGTASRALSHLSERHPRAAGPLMWQARLHLLRARQFWAKDATGEVAQAKYLLARALDLQPEHPLTLSLAGHWQVLEEGDVPQARQRVLRAVELAPEESQAWLHAAQLHCSADEGEQAWAAVSEARRLAPLHPQAYLYDLFAAYAAFVRGDHRRAAELGTRSLRANRLHVGSYPVTIAAHLLDGQGDRARQLLRDYREVYPSAGWRDLEARNRAAPRLRDLLVGAMRDCGLPA